MTNPTRVPFELGNFDKQLFEKTAKRTTVNAMPNAIDTAIHNHILHKEVSDFYREIPKELIYAHGAMVSWLYACIEDLEGKEPDQPRLKELLDSTKGFITEMHTLSQAWGIVTHELAPFNVAKDDSLCKMLAQYAKEHGHQSALKIPELGSAIRGMLLQKQAREVYKLTVEMLRREPVFIEKFANAKYRARMVAYFFSVLLFNCRHDNFELADEILDKCGGFSFETEVSKGAKWMMPATGSLFDDLRVNFVARYIKNSNQETAISIMTDCLNGISSQIGEACCRNKDEEPINPFLPRIHLEEYYEGYEYEWEFENEVESFCELFESEPGKISPYTCMAPVSKRLPRIPLLTSSNIICQYLSPEDREHLPQYVLDRRLMGGEDAENEEWDVSIGINYDVDDPRDTPTRDVYLPFLPAPDVQELAPHVYAPFFHARNIDRERYNLQAEAIAETKRKKEGKFYSKRDKEISEKDAKIKELENKVDALSKGNHSKEELIKMLQSKADKASKQAARIDNLEKENAKSDRRIEELKADLTSAMARVSLLESEIDALQKASEQQSGTLDEASDEEEMGLAALYNEAKAVFDKKKIVIVGGHISWVQEMRNFHPNVRVYSRAADTLTGYEDALQYADMLWIQPNSISHSTFFNAMHIAKARKIPTMNFEYAGHRPCELQLMKECMSRFA